MFKSDYRSYKYENDQTISWLKRKLTLELLSDMWSLCIRLSFFSSLLHFLFSSFFPKQSTTPWSSVSEAWWWTTLSAMITAKARKNRHSNYVKMMGFYCIWSSKFWECLNDKCTCLKGVVMDVYIGVELWVNFLY